MSEVTTTPQNAWSEQPSDPMGDWTFQPIGVLSTCFKEKFGIPRQSGMVMGAEGILKLRDDPFLQRATRELDGFSHLWIVFVFHKHDSKSWKPSIRPPRLGGAKKVGVLASRSPHRPNPIGLSAVKLKRIDWDAPGGVEIHLEGVDILDGTPVLDIKPYLPYADAITDASSGWAGAPIERVDVNFTEQALLAISQREPNRPQLKPMIIEMLSLDPRPASQRRRLPRSSDQAQGTRYGFNLHEFDVKWEIRDEQFWVTDVIDLPERP